MDKYKSKVNVKKHLYVSLAHYVAVQGAERPLMSLHGAEGGQTDARPACHHIWLLDAYQNGPSYSVFFSSIFILLILYHYYYISGIPKKSCSNNHVKEDLLIVMLAYCKCFKETK